MDKIYVDEKREKMVEIVSHHKIKALGLNLLDWDNLFKDLKLTLHFEKSKK